MPRQWPVRRCNNKQTLIHVRKIDNKYRREICWIPWEKDPPFAAFFYNLVQRAVCGTTFDKEYIEPQGWSKKEPPGGRLVQNYELNAGLHGVLAN